MDEEPLGDVLERYERSKALYKVLDAELTLLDVEVSELANRVLALEDELENIRPKSEDEILSEQKYEELEPLRELRQSALELAKSALKLAEEEYSRQCEKIEAEYEAKAQPIKERFKRLEEDLFDEDEVWISDYDWYKQNSPEYAKLSEELRLLKVKRSEVGNKRTVTRRELNASRDEKIRRLGK